MQQKASECDMDFRHVASWRYAWVLFVLGGVLEAGSHRLTSMQGICFPVLVLCLPTSPAYCHLCVLIVVGNGSNFDVCASWEECRVLVPNVETTHYFLRGAPCLLVVRAVLNGESVIVMAAVGSIVVGDVALILTDLGAAGSVELFQA